MCGGISGSCPKQRHASANSYTQWKVCDFITSIFPLPQNKYESKWIQLPNDCWEIDRLMTDSKRSKRLLLVLTDSSKAVEEMAHRP
jgi:hypothetical protein